LVLAMMIQHGVRWRVTMHHELGMPMGFALVDVLGCGDRQQADSHGQCTRDDSRHPHKLNRMRRRAAPANFPVHSGHGARSAILCGMTTQMRHLLEKER
jgi:hypothetical protein